MANKTINLIELIMDAFEKSQTQEGYEKFSTLQGRYMQLAEDELLSKGYTAVSWPGIYPMVTDGEGRTYTVGSDDCDRFLGKIDPLRIEMRMLTAEANVVYLPSRDVGELTQYAEIKKILLNAGSKYKRNTFVFADGTDAQKILDDLIEGSRPNKRKELQQFFTPSTVAARVRELAQIGDGMMILEPSAGRGALVDGLQAHVCEIDESLHRVLTEAGHVVVGKDFLKVYTTMFSRYDRIVANPPFTKGADVNHFNCMWQCLKYGGRLVCVMSKHWTFATDKKSTEFRSFLEERGAIVEEVPAGAFSQSGTDIPTVIVAVDK